MKFRSSPMAISSLARFLSHSIQTQIPSIPLISSSLPFTTSLSSSPSSSSTASKLYVQLVSHPQNPEKTLFTTLKSRLDSTSVTQVCLLCSQNQQSHLGLRFFIWAALQPGYRHSRFIYSQVCNFFGIHQNPTRVRELVEGYETDGCVVNVKMAKVVLNLCREAGDADLALWVLRRMGQFGCRMDTVAYNVVIGLSREKGNLDAAVELMREMVVMGLYPDMITYVEMINALCHAGRLEDACGLFKDMRDHSCMPNAVAYSALLHWVCKLGSSNRVLELLEEMEKEGGTCSPNVITYTSVIQGFLEKGQHVEALEILDRMETLGCAPNRVTVSVLVKGLCSKGYVDEAYQVVDKIAAGGSVSKTSCYSSLMLGLLSIRRLDAAEKLLRKMVTNEIKPNDCACSRLIRDVCFTGRVFDGFYLVREVTTMGVLPILDSAVYHILSNGLQLKGLLVEATELARLKDEQRIQVEFVVRTPGMDLTLGEKLKY
ncbi:hypothetical protein Drorol1_Dr00023704 [Drosera rotundifolia]